MTDYYGKDFLHTYLLAQGNMVGYFTETSAIELLELLLNFLYCCLDSLV